MAEQASPWPTSSLEDAQTLALVWNEECPTCLAPPGALCRARSVIDAVPATFHLARAEASFPPEPPRLKVTREAIRQVAVMAHLRTLEGWDRNAILAELEERINEREG